MRSLTEAQKGWKEHLECTDITALKSKLWAEKNTEHRLIENRSLLWKSFILFETTLQAPECLSILRDSRSAFSTLRNTYLRAIDHPASVDEDGIDPLTEDEQSLWNALRADEIVREEIWRDVDRCMPDNEYFRDPRIQKLLLDVLFVWCKLNPDIGYRQGMHEVLAPIVLVLDTDATDTEDASAEEAIAAEMMDSRYLEHDSFTLFARIMQTAKSFYEPADPNVEESESPMINRSRRIFHELLPTVDLELAYHLKKIEVLPQIFLMRWVRLLFGREFPFDDVLEMWDLIFSDGIQLSLVDYTCVAMLIHIRWQLLEADTNTALSLLLRYPTLESSKPRDLVYDAKAIRQDPSARTGAALILKYTGRQVAIVNASDFAPSTPTKAPFRARSPFAAASSPASLESLLQDVARGAISRGEKWGLNQAVRDVVGEVRKNVTRGIQNTTSANSSRPTSPQRGLRGSRGGSQTHGMIAANVLRKLNALEERNRRLAELLDGAVKDLWQCHEKLVEQDKASTVDEIRNHLNQQLSKNIAEVQFVQAFLRDMTLPLPDLPSKEENKEYSFSDSPGKDPEKQDMLKSAENSMHARKRSESANDLSRSAKATRQTPSTSPTRSQAARMVASPILIPGRSANISRASASSLPPPIPTSSTPDPLLSRPRLTSTSFSWMLADERGEPSSTKPAAFPKATPFAPNEKRSYARNGKGFLFGEDEGNENFDTSEQRRSSPMRKQFSKGSNRTKASAPIRVATDDIKLTDVSSADEKRKPMQESNAAEGDVKD